MSLFALLFNNLFSLPLICFIFGAFFEKFRIKREITSLLGIYILFCIGLKGGKAFGESVSTTTSAFFWILCTLVSWGFIQPAISFFLLRRLTNLDRATISAISASFGSVSVMTYVTATSFLEYLCVPYQPFVVAILAIMEVPAIVAGIFLAKSNLFPQFAYTQGRCESVHSFTIQKLGSLILESLFNKVIIALGLGMLLGSLLTVKGGCQIVDFALVPFKFLLCLFLFDLGTQVAAKRSAFASFSWPLYLFGLCMPLLGAFFGLLVSFIFGLDAGTGALILCLTASASYIAVPAAVKQVLPEANEGVYLPLSLGLAFPFNVLVGIPIYYYLAATVLI